MERQKTGRMKVDSGMVVVIFICLMYIVLVFGLLFYVKNDWCELLFKNMTVHWVGKHHFFCDIFIKM